jgi:hypothetical protein
MPDTKKDASNRGQFTVRSTSLSWRHLPDYWNRLFIARSSGTAPPWEGDNMAYFVYQSAKDNLTKDPKSDTLSEVFHFGHAEGHRIIVLYGWLKFCASA